MTYGRAHNKRSIELPNNSYPSYKLNFECTLQSNRLKATETFERIYDNGEWGSNESKSGRGSEIGGAIDWIGYLSSIINQYRIRYVADIPCGDTNWQFASREMNTVSFYFGGDISTSAISHNQKRYYYHLNKMFLFWDLVQCPIPRFSIQNSTRSFANNTFDLLMIRDAIQHLNIFNGLKVMRNVIMSDITYLVVSSYPSKTCVDYCVVGNITEGGWYANNINCPPFNFPPPLMKVPSHRTIQHEHDELHLYKIDTRFIKISENYHRACR